LRELRGKPNGEADLINIAKPLLDEHAIKDIEAAIHSGNLAQGKQVQLFEEAFAKYIGTEYAVAVNSGTAALHMALLAAGIQGGDEVITTSFSFIASANSILMCRARPVFVDIESDTYNIDPSLIKSKINPKTKAILAVHLYGQPFDIGAISDICKEKRLVLIEDACQAHGAEYFGRKVGSFGIGCFSFYPTKNMTTGEGGMITTNDVQIADRCRLLRNHGQQEHYHHVILGYNYRMTEIEAAIGLSQLARLEEFNQRRIENAAFLTSAIAKIPGLIPPVVRPDIKHVFHQFTVRVTEEYQLTRDQLQEYLRSQNVGSAIHYAVPIYRQPLYTSLGYTENLSVTEEASREVISLPIHPALTRDDLNSITEALESV
jgi:dTDP-4-amino-4,6-dideoxygalactose transaminase